MRQAGQIRIRRRSMNRDMRVSRRFLPYTGKHDGPKLHFMKATKTFLFLLLVLAAPNMAVAGPRRTSAKRIRYSLTAPLPTNARGRRHVRGDPPSGRNRPESLEAMAAFEEEAFAARLMAISSARPRPRNPSRRLSRPRKQNGQGGDSSRLVPVPPPGVPAWMHGLRRPSLPFRWNRRVIRYLKFYHDTDRGRSILRSWFRAMGRYDELIRSYLRRAGLPEDLIFVAMIESGFRPTSVSYAGASGLWQFMPQGGRIYGLRYDYWIDERRDPLRATMAAVRYLSDLHHRFGNWHLALAAFNAGYGAVQRAMRMFNTNDYWALCSMESGLPYATTNYVPKILAVATVGHNLAEFGLSDLQPLAPWRFELVTVPGPFHLKRLARMAKTTYEVLQRLNPALRRGRIPPGYHGYQIRVPLETAGKLLSALTKIGRFGRKYRAHHLRWGETLDDLAREYGTTTTAIRRLNGIRSSLELRPGIALLVPAGRKARNRIRPGKESSRFLAAVPSLVEPPRGRREVYYRTLHGDRVGSLARLFGVKVSEVTKWNLVTPHAKLPSGLMLRFYVPPGADLSRIKTYRPDEVDLVEVDSPAFRRASLRRRGLYRIVYRAKKGDRLRKVARRFGMSPGSVARINHISRFSKLRPGQPIVLYVRNRRLRRLGLARLVRWTNPVESPNKTRKRATETVRKPTARHPGRPSARSVSRPAPRPTKHSSPRTARPPARPVRTQKR